jgi:hypothetical protein
VVHREARASQTDRPILQIRVWDVAFIPGCYDFTTLTTNGKARLGYVLHAEWDVTTKDFS